MTDRIVLDGAFSGPFPDDGAAEGYGNNIARHLRVLFDHSVLRLSAVTGINAIAAAVEPELLSTGLAPGMNFILTPVATSTGAVTLNVGATSAVPVVSADGAALAPGDLAAGATVLLHYTGAAFRILGQASTGGGEVPVDRQVFTASGTWTKPAGLDADRLVLVRLWGAGGGGTAANNGNSGAGGGGGEFVEFLVRLGDLNATVAVTVGAGGAGAVGGNAAGNGGASSFGALVTALGGTGSPSTGTGGDGAGLNPGLGGITTTTASSDAGDIWSGGGGASSGFVGRNARLGGGGGGSRTSSSGTRPPAPCCWAAMAARRTAPDRRPAAAAAAAMRRAPARRAARARADRWR